MVKSKDINSDQVDLWIFFNVLVISLWLLEYIVLTILTYWLRLTIFFCFIFKFNSSYQLSIGFVYIELTFSYVDTLNQSYYLFAIRFIESNTFQIWISSFSFVIYRFIVFRYQIILGSQSIEEVVSVLFYSLKINLSIM